MKELVELFEKIVDILKNFKEYFIPLLVAYVFAVMVYTLMPENNIIQTKAGEFAFGAFIYVICFLVTLFIIKIYKGMQDKKYEKKQKEEMAQKELALREQKEKKNLEEVWRLIDSLDTVEKKAVNLLVSNGNKQVFVYEYNNTYSMQRFRQLVNYSHVQKGDSGVKIDEYDTSQFVFYDDYKAYIKCKLKDDIYALLKKSMQQYGKISHFDVR